MRHSVYFWFFTAAVLIFLVGSELIKDGMFMDGLQYACVSKNLAFGKGTFWFPYLCETWSKSNSVYFMEHPPLAYAIQSFFFKVTGNSMYAERIYSFFTALVHVLLIALLWTKITGKNDDRYFSWLPVLLWIIIPVCFWSFRNNMQENTMGMFTTASVYFSVLVIRQKKMKSLFLLLSGVCIFLATLSKGIPGLFPVVFFILWFILTKEIKFTRSLIFTITLVAIPSAIYALLMINENADASLRFYFFDRLIYRISEEPVVNSRFYIIIRLFSELIVPVGLMVILFFFSKIRKSKNQFKNEYFRVSLVFLGVALAGSLPLMLTEVQRGFYLTPSLPFFALCFGLFLLPYIKKIAKPIIQGNSASVMITIITAASFIFSIVFTGFQKGKAARDADILKDVYLLGKNIPEHTVVFTDFSLYSKWNLHFYFIRYFDICFTPDYKSHNFMITEKGSVIPDSTVYEKIEIGTVRYDLYKRAHF